MAYQKNAGFVVWDMDKTNHYKTYVIHFKVYLQKQIIIFLLCSIFFVIITSKQPNRTFFFNITWNA